MDYHAAIFSIGYIHFDQTGTLSWSKDKFRGGHLTTEIWVCLYGMTLLAKILSLFVEIEWELLYAQVSQSSISQNPKSKVVLNRIFNGNCTEL